MAVSHADLRRLDLFATPAAVIVPPDAATLNGSLAQRVQQLWQASAGASAPLPWQSPPQVLAQDDGLLGPLAWMVATIAEAMVPVRRPGGQPQAGWDVLWFAEVFQPGQGLPIHDFPRANWCGCYLIDDGGAAGKSGEIELQDPRGPAVMTYAPDLTFDAPGGETLGISQTVSLTSGSLLVFPAWMRQGTAVHRGGRPRLSVKLLLNQRG